jgi:plastocyanin
MIIRKTKALAAAAAALVAAIALAGCQTGPHMGAGASDPAFLRGDSQASNTTREAPTAQPDQPSQPSQIAIDNFTFKPAMLWVAAGSEVVWVNHDDVPHTIVADDKTFKSATLDTDDRFTHAFPATGTYRYFCGVHPHMTGVVVVH